MPIIVTMISVANYPERIDRIDIKSLPAMLQEGHSFFTEASHLYNEDQVIRETLDLYVEKLNEYLAGKKSKGLGHTKSKKRCVGDVKFIERFVSLHNQIQSKQQIADFIKALQQAIIGKKIRKSSPFSNHIEQIQQKLINRHNMLPENGSVRISINKQWLGELKRIISGPSSSIGYLNGLNNIHDHHVIPVKTKKRDVRIFDSMDKIDNEPSVDSFRLKGDLGQFLGDMERFELAMTIEGDQGGGKTRFAYQLADAFSDLGNRVAIFSLEIGRKSDLIRRMREEYLRPANLRNIFIADQLPKGLDTIKEAANDFDVIILDSWNKVGVPSLEFDRLRKAYPNTIFIVIFQRTTQKTIRGGTAPLFDAGINIEVVKVDDTFVNNYAVATKNRYGVTGIRYNISQQEIEHTKATGDPVTNKQDTLIS